jgi:hypothetical protein
MEKQEVMDYCFKVFKVSVCILILSIAVWALMIYFAPSPH